VTIAPLFAVSVVRLYVFEIRKSAKALFVVLGLLTLLKVTRPCTFPVLAPVAELSSDYCASTKSTPA